MLDVSFFLLGLNVNSAIASGDFTATSVIDPVNGAYTFNGTMVALADIIDVTGPYFDPATDIDAGGVKMLKDNGSGIQVDFTGDLLTAMLEGGFTIVIEMLTGVSAFTIGVQAADPPSYNFDAYSHYDAEFTEHEFTYTLQGADGNTLDGFTDTDLGPGDNVTQVSPSSVVRLAYTLTDDRVALSIAGDTAVVYMNPPIVAQSTAVAFNPVAQLGDTTARVRKFTVYAPVDDADLPGLSAP